VARELGLPFIVSAHGTLEPWAWRHHSWKKRPAWWLWVHRDLRSAVVLRATARQEVEAMRTLGLRNPIALIPNGVDLPPASQKAGIRGQKPGVRSALFVSRIHPKKGLLNLVVAWSQVRPAGWRAVVCGPDECGHTQEVKQAVAEAGLSGVFDFMSPVYDAEKDALYASADLFVLPTFSENFGLVIAEALAAGVPVVTTKGTPWEELHTHQCGWWIDIGVEPLVAALREAVALSDEQRRNMGQRGRRLVEENYGWPKIGRDMKAVYGWVLGKEPMPECVQTKS
jgi:glycosyltransferase involved in cell wall biosynthesis